MNAHTILTKFIDLVSVNMYKKRKLALSACVSSILNGRAATVTSFGRGILSKAYEKHRIKRADRLLSNGNSQREVPVIYAMMCRLSECDLP